MPDDDRIAEILVAWEEARQQDREISVESLCKESPELISEVKRRIAILGAMESALDSSSQDDAETIRVGSTRERGWIDLPNYECLGTLGSGGMGVVFQARQIRLDRIVAVKVLRPHGLSANQIARLQTEAEAAARLNHPNIVGIHEIGEHNDCPYLVLEFIQGGTLAAQIANTTFTSQEAARLMESCARAIQFAHDAGIIHRDLKPANVLLAEDGSPKIADFGLAKRLEDDSHLTQTGDVMGTPSYMAPEQARGMTGDVSPRTDVYALGASLYEMLTGRPPFKGATPLDTVRQVVDRDVLPPSRLHFGLPRDLETVCLKCLRKDAIQRYATALELAEDLRRFQNGEPVVARPIGVVARSVRWIRRHPLQTALATAAVVVMLLLVGLFVAGRYQSELENSLEREQQLTGELKTANERIEQTHHLKQVAFALSLWRDGDVRRARSTLQSIPATRRDWEWRYVNRLCHAELATFRGHQDRSVDLVSGTVVTALAFDRDNLAVASGDSRGVIHIWEKDTGKILRTIKGHETAITALSFHPERREIVTQSDDGVLKIWDLKTGKAIRTLEGHKGSSRIAWNPAGTRLASCGDDKVVKIWDTQNWEVVSTLRHTEPVRDVAFSRDSQRVGTVTATAVRFWSADKGLPLPVQESSFFEGEPERIVFLGGQAEPVIIGKSSMPGQRPQDVWCVAISPDGKTIAGGGHYPTVTVNNYLGDDRTAVKLKGHETSIQAVAFSPNGRFLASSSRDGLVKVWNVAVDRESEVIKTRPFEYTPITAVRFVSNKRLVFTGGVGKNSNAPSPAGFVAFDTLRNNSAATSRREKERVAAIALSRNRKRLAVAFEDRTVRLLDAETGMVTETWSTRSADLLAMAFHPNGQRLAIAGSDKIVRIRDAHTGKLLASLKGHSASITTINFNETGKQLISGSKDKTAIVWDLASGRIVRQLDGHGSAVFAADFVNGNSLAATGDEYGTVRIWDLDSGKVRYILAGHTAQVTGIAMSPDGKRIATASLDRTVRVWDAATGLEAIVLANRLKEPFRDIAFSPDGKRIAAAGRNAVQVWESEATHASGNEP